MVNSNLSIILLCVLANNFSQDNEMSILKYQDKYDINNNSNNSNNK